MKKQLIITGMLMALFFCACQDYESVAPVVPIEVDEYDGTLLDFLTDPANKGRYASFDSLVTVIENIPGLKEVLGKEGEFYTLFAAPDECFTHAFNELNTYRERNNFGGKIALKDLLIEPFSVNDTTFIPRGNNREDTIVNTRNYDYRAQMDTLLCRYIFKGSYVSDEIKKEAGGSLSLESFKYRYQMNMSCINQPASGIMDGGSALLELNDMNESQLEERWNRAPVVRRDIHTRNAVIHILAENHAFSYNHFIYYFFYRGNEYEK